MQIWCCRITVPVVSNQGRYLCFVLLPNFASVIISTLPNDDLMPNRSSKSSLCLNPVIPMIFVTLSTTYKKSTCSSWVWETPPYWTSKFIRILMLLPQRNTRNSTFLFPWDLSEMFYIIVIPITLLLWIVVCLRKPSPDIFASVHRDSQCIHCFITYKLH